MALILVVEDAADFRTLLCEALEISGHKVVLSKSGKEALRQCRGRSFDVVVTDVVMPDVDGIELIRALRALPRQVPIIAISGASVDMLEIVKALGAQATLRKPFDLQELLAAINQVLGKQQD